MTYSLDRRQFLGATVGAGLALAGAGRAADKSPNEKLNLAIVGTGNKGWHNVEQLRGQNIVALCDVDANFLGKAAQQFPNASQYRDYRKLLDAEANKIDAVVVSTADHTHAGPTAIAITLGKHVYCEKPLTHTVTEARHLAKLAGRFRVATQMGTQIHAENNYRRVVEVVRSGAIGQVKEVYNWCNKGWSNGRFQAAKPVPANLDWDLWLGPAKQRPYSPDIHPANWRRFWEYGSGTFGDMAAHVMDLPFWALNLRRPTKIVATGPEVHPDGAPAWCKAEYEFLIGTAEPGGPRPLKFFWSDGGEHHDPVKQTRGHNGKPLSQWGLGVLFVGDKGMLAADYGHYELLPKDKFTDFKAPPQTIPASVGHWNEWVQACKTGSQTTCNFSYSGALTETILLGVVAYRVGKPIYWDANDLKATGLAEADAYLTKEYRKGWEIAGMS